jgi:serine/threonine-protein kinase
MSPEQVKGVAGIDHRSDIFSMGLVLYEMLTGKQLFSGSNDEIKSRILNKDFDANLLNDLGLPFEIAEILTRSLQRNRNARYERSIDMYRDLRRILKGIEDEEIVLDLASFVLKIMDREHSESVHIANLAKSLDKKEIISNPSTIKVNANDFMGGYIPIEEDSSKINQTPISETPIQFQSQRDQEVN